MTRHESARTMNMAWRAAEILEEAGVRSSEDIARRIVRESGLSWTEHGSEAQRVVDDVVSGARVVDLRRSGHFAL